MTKKELIKHLVGVKDDDEVKMLLVDESDRNRKPLSLDIFHTKNKLLFIVF